MSTESESALRRELVAALKGGNAHARFEDVVAKFPVQLRGSKAGLPYSAWQLLEHIRLAQNDILRFCNYQDGGYREMNFPDDYWPKSASPPSEKAWEESIASALADREAMIQLVSDAGRKLAEAFAWGDGQNLLREAILVVDHNSYHTGELVSLRRLLRIWPVR
jgi:hypothetical protein